ncbi:MAG: Na+/H+ antiporter NhaA [Marinilabiliales bacterium]|nr:Na+/H+ antiporter NhaA [Marinilabiliales bacterium]
MRSRFKQFFDNERSGGIVLLLVTLCSLLMANSSLQQGYLAFWDHPLGGHSLVHWINDGLMALFFLYIGLELEREIYQGELSHVKKASLPIFAALGGMVVPALIFLMFNHGTPTQSGAGIPMATDIAFAIGILSLLGNRVPLSLKIFLTALAVIDDLGAILVIAFFYTQTLSMIYLALAMGIFLVLIVLNRQKVMHLAPYLIGGTAMWYCLLHSGVHATLSGVLLAFAIPFRDGSSKTPSARLLHFLHKPVSFFILPLFALANTALVFNMNADSLLQPLTFGILAGLFLGKPLGIWLFSLASVRLKICALPSGIRMSHLLGAGFLGGIGFTMSIFITLLALQGPDLINVAKMAIIGGSLLSGLTGYLWLDRLLRKAHPPH